MNNRGNFLLGLGILSGAVLYSLRAKREPSSSKRIKKDNWSTDELGQLICNGFVIFKNGEVISLINDNHLFEKLKEIKFGIQATIIADYIFDVCKKEDIIGINIAYNKSPVVIKKLYFELEPDKRAFESILNNINKIKISKIEFIKNEED